MAGEKAQKRGGGSSGGGSGVNKFLGNSATAGHLDDRYSDNEERAQFLQEALGLSEDEAYEMAVAFEDFTGGDYSDIRYAMYHNNTNSDFYAEGQRLEEYISKSPKYYNKGEIYRGIKLTDAEAENLVNTLSNGGVIDMRGISSWSSNLSTAKNFAANPTGSSIVFRLPNGTKAGASIRHVSEYFGENEVLVSMKTQYSASKIVQTGTGHWEIYLVETVVA